MSREFRTKRQPRYQVKATKIAIEIMIVKARRTSEEPSPPGAPSSGSHMIVRRASEVLLLYVPNPLQMMMLPRRGREGGREEGAVMGDPRILSCGWM